MSTAVLFRALKIMGAEQRGQGSNLTGTLMKPLSHLSVTTERPVNTLFYTIGSTLEAGGRASINKPDLARLEALLCVEALLLDHSSELQPKMNLQAPSSVL